LVPLLRTDSHPNQWSVLFTERTHRVGTHKGQVSFPGGKLEPALDGSSAVACALRESREEIGLPIENVQVLGLFHDVLSITNVNVSTVVAVLRGPPQLLNPTGGDSADPAEMPSPFPLGLLRPSEQEVQSVFAVDLLTLQQCAKRERLSPNRGEFPVFPVPDRPLIWGLTAYVVGELMETVFHMPLSRQSR
jgi:8-oxo-dGTP pyrophosphatase MutT (NUDIX family)